MQATEPKALDPAGPNTRAIAYIRRVQITSGLILFLFVTTHLMNHSLGLWSFEWLEAGRGVFVAFWQSPPMSLVFYGALILHMILALKAVYVRDSLRSISRTEWLQLVLGFSLPPLLAMHLMGTRGAHELNEVVIHYIDTLRVLWHFKPTMGVLQAVALVVVWLHGCIGLHQWFRFRRGYVQWRPYLLVFAVLLPTLALAGYIAAGAEVLARVQLEAAKPSPATAPVTAPVTNPYPSDEDGYDYGPAEPRFSVAELEAIAANMRLGALILLVSALTLRLVRRWRAQQRLGIGVRYDDGREIRIALGTSILDASREHGIDHASVCGGRGRCSTCRVRIAGDPAELPPPSEAELRVLRRVGAAPNVRLACQLHPTSDVAVTLLLPPRADAEAGAPRPGYLQGEEREIAVLFADLRDFTGFSEHRLPYDVVFVLNRYFAEMGHAIEAAGGRIDKFVGDGIMALFGVEAGVETGSRRALAAARGMAAALDRLNQAMAQDLKEPLRIGIGIHAGPAIVGEMGYGEARGMTAIGDTVNTASRLEALTKQHGAQLIVSEATVMAAGVDLSAYPEISLDIRGREEPLGARIVTTAGELSDPGPTT